MSPRAGLALVLSLVAACAHAATAPAWLLEAASRPLPPGSDRAEAALLHMERIVTVPARGRIQTRSRLALRILSHEGEDLASLEAPYVRGSSEVKDLHAWLLAGNGAVVAHLERKDAIDVSDLSAEQLYSEIRHLAIEAPGAKSGQTWAYEVVYEEDPLLAQWSAPIRHTLPCAWWRFSIELPPGFEAHAQVPEGDTLAADHQGAVWSWEAHNVPAIPREDLAPSGDNPAGSLNVQAFATGAARSGVGQAFRSWPELSKWLADLVRSQAALTPDITAQAHEAAGDTRDTVERIGAIGRYVQRLNYVSHDERIGEGWGFRPHDAAAVLAAGYGDCKDKANLLRAMLAAEGVQAWLLPVFSGDRDRVDSTWCSPGQFNHCITAIRMPANYRGPTIRSDALGALAVFDPTDPLTAFGDLPRDEQGSWGLLVDERAGGLVRLPEIGPAQNQMTRFVDASLDSTGQLHAKLTEHSVGQTARAEREERRSRREAEYRQLLEKWLATPGGTVELLAVQVADDSVRGRFDLEARYIAPRFARFVGDRTLMFRPAVTHARDSWVPADGARQSPIALPSSSVAETLVVRLPDGFRVDESPADLKFSSDLGRLDVTWAVEGGTLTMTRRWEVRPLTVPASRWRDVRALFSAYRESNAAAVVLVPQ